MVNCSAPLKPWDRGEIQPSEIQLAFQKAKQYDSTVEMLQSQIEQLMGQRNYFASELGKTKQKLKTTMKILNDSTGGEWYIKSMGSQNWVNYDSAIRYYHAVCKALDILETSD